MDENSDKLRITEMRRSDRAQTESWIRQFLKRAPFLFIAVAAEDEPFVTCTNFVYLDKSRRIYLHTSPSAQLRKRAESEPMVSVMASEMGRLLDSKTAGGFSVEYASVVARGHIGLVTDAEEATAALVELIQKYFPDQEEGRQYAPIKPTDLKATAVYCIKIAEWSGKARHADLDFSGQSKYHRGYFHRPTTD